MRSTNWILLSGSGWSRSSTEVFLSGQEADKLPDIKLHNSEGVFDDRVGSLSFQNPFYGPVPEDLSIVKHAAFTGDKGPNPPSAWLARKHRCL